MAKDIFFSLNIKGDQVAIQRATDIKLAISEINKELKVTEDNEAYDALEEDLLRLKAELQNVSREQRNFVRDLNAAKTGEGSYRQLDAELIKLRQEFKDLSEAEREFGRGREIEDRIKVLDGELKELDGRIGQFQRNVGNYPETIGQAISEVLPEFGKLSEGLENIGQIGTATGKILAGGFLAFEVVSEGIRKLGEIKEFVDDIQSLRDRVELLTGETGKGLDNIVVKMRALSETFGEGEDEILLAAKALSENFGISGEEALKKIEDGFVAGLNINGDFLDTLKEYPAQFKAIGGDADDFLSIISKNIDEGVFSDKGIDAVKEAGIALRELTPATEEALNGIGVTASDIRDVIDKDGIGGAIELVSKKLEGFEDDSIEVGRVLADVFKGAGEDAGIDFIRSLNDVGGSFEDLIDRQSEAVIRQEEYLRSQEAIAEAQNRVTVLLSGASDEFTFLGNQIKANVLNSLADFLEFLIDIPKFLKENREEIGFLIVSLVAFNAQMIISRTQAFLTTGVFSAISAVTKGWRIAQTALNVALRSNPIGLVVSAVALLLAGFSAAYDRSEDFRASIQGLGNVAREVFEIVKESVASFVEGFQAIREGRVKDALGEFGDAFKKSNPIGIAFSQGERLKGAFIEGFERSKTKDALDKEAKVLEDGLKKLNKVREDNGGGSSSDGGGSNVGGSGLSDSEKKALENREKELEKKRSEELRNEERFYKEKGKLLNELTKELIDLEVENIKEESSREIREEEVRFERRLSELESQRDKLLNNSSSNGDDRIEIERKVNEVIEKEREKSEEVISKLREESLRSEAVDRLEAVREDLERFDEIEELRLSKLRENRLRGLLTEEELASQSFEIRKEGIEREIEELNKSIDEAVIKRDLGILSNDEVREIVNRRQGLNEDLAELENERTEKVKEETQKRINENINEFEKVLENVQKVFDIIGGLENAFDDREKARVEESIEEREKLIEDLEDKEEKATGKQKRELNERIRNEKKALEELEEDKEEIELRSAKRKKKLAVLESIIDTALAVAKALKNAPGPPLSIPQAIAAGIFGAGQTAVIAAQPLADGGEAVGVDSKRVRRASVVPVALDGGRLVNVPSNIPQLSNGDDVLATVKRGELMMNKLQQIKAKALYGNDIFKRIGVPGFVDGGVVGGNSVIPDVSGIGESRGDFMEVVKKLDEKTDMISRRVDNIRVMVVSEDVINDIEERDEILASVEIG